MKGRTMGARVIMAGVGAWVGVAAASAVGGCADAPGAETAETSAISATSATSEIDAASSPPSVGLAIEVENGAGVPLRLERGRRFHLAQVDLRASITATADEGVAGLRVRGDFEDLPWGGIAWTTRSSCCSRMRTTRSGAAGSSATPRG